MTVSLYFSTFLCISFVGGKGIGTVEPTRHDGVSDVIFVVLSQQNGHHEQRSNQFIKHLRAQDEDAIIYETHKRWPAVMTRGAWAVIPTLADILLDHGTASWVFYCEEDSRVDIKGLRNHLNLLDHSKPLFLGHALHDTSPVIIHHFAFVDNPSSFDYPDVAAGFVLSMSLVNILVERLKTEKLDHEFTIDMKHELAMFIWNKDAGTRLTDVQWMCTRPDKQDGCVTYYRPRPCISKIVSPADVYIAVKTFHENHKTRVSVVRRTWGKDIENIEYLSDEKDKFIPTVKLNVPNTKQGHCGKLMAILERAHLEPKWAVKKWVVIADDDTIFNINRLLQLLSCYDHSEALVIGERYGYGVVSGFGYDYPTGGAGMILSRQAVFMLMESGECACATNESPDDMTLGMCLQRLDIPLIHSHLLHQARPLDYSPDYLSHMDSVSFHKHWNIDPLMVYSDWLKAGDIAPPIEDKKEEL